MLYVSPRRSRFLRKPAKWPAHSSHRKSAECGAWSATAWQPGISTTLHHWFNQHVGWFAVGVAGTTAYAAAAIALLLAATDWIAAAAGWSYPRAWRRTALSLYRLAIIAAFSALAIGFTVEKLNEKTSSGWNSIATMAANGAGHS